MSKNKLEHQEHLTNDRNTIDTNLDAFDLYTDVTLEHLAGGPLFEAVREAMIEDQEIRASFQTCINILLNDAELPEHTSNTLKKSIGTLINHLRAYIEEQYETPPEGFDDDKKLEDMIHRQPEFQRAILHYSLTPLENYQTQDISMRNALFNDYQAKTIRTDSALENIQNQGDREGYLQANPLTGEQATGESPYKNNNVLQRLDAIRTAFSGNPGDVLPDPAISQVLNEQIANFIAEGSLLPKQFNIRSSNASGRIRKMGLTQTTTGLASPEQAQRAMQAARTKSRNNCVLPTGTYIQQIHNAGDTRAVRAGSGKRTQREQLSPEIAQENLVIAFSKLPVGDAVYDIDQSNRTVHQLNVTHADEAIADAQSAGIPSRDIEQTSGYENYLRTKQQVQGFEEQETQKQQALLRQQQAEVIQQKVHVAQTTVNSLPDTSSFSITNLQEAKQALDEATTAIADAELAGASSHQIATLQQLPKYVALKERVDALEKENNANEQQEQKERAKTKTIEAFAQLPERRRGLRRNQRDQETASLFSEAQESVAEAMRNGWTREEIALWPNYDRFEKTNEEDSFGNPEYVFGDESSESIQKSAEAMTVYNQQISAITTTEEGNNLQTEITQNSDLDESSKQELLQTLHQKISSLEKEAAAYRTKAIRNMSNPNEAPTLRNGIEEEVNLTQTQKLDLQRVLTQKTKTLTTKNTTQEIRATIQSYEQQIEIAFDKNNPANKEDVEALKGRIQEEDDNVLPQVDKMRLLQEIDGLLQKQNEQEQELSLQAYEDEIKATITPKVNPSPADVLALQRRINNDPVLSSENKQALQETVRQAVERLPNESKNEIQEDLAQQERIQLYTTSIENAGKSTECESIKQAIAGDTVLTSENQAYLTGVANEKKQQIETQASSTITQLISSMSTINQYEGILGAINNNQSLEPATKASLQQALDGKKEELINQAENKYITMIENLKTSEDPLQEGRLIPSQIQGEQNLTASKKDELTIRLNNTLTNIMEEQLASEEDDILAEGMELAPEVSFAPTTAGNIARYVTTVTQNTNWLAIHRGDANDDMRTNERTPENIQTLGALYNRFQTESKTPLIVTASDLMAIGYIETRYNHTLTGTNGKGLLQLTSAVHRNIELHGNTEALYDKPFLNTLLSQSPSQPTYTIQEIVSSAPKRRQALARPYENAVLGLAHLHVTQEYSNSPSKRRTIIASIRNTSNVVKATYSLLKRRGIAIDEDDKATLQQLVERIQQADANPVLFRRFSTIWQYNGNDRDYSNGIDTRVAYGVAALYLSENIFGFDVTLPGNTENNNEQNIQNLMQQGYELIQTKQYIQAKQKYQEALSLTPAGDTNQKNLITYHLELIEKLQGQDEALQAGDSAKQQNKLTEARKHYQRATTFFEKDDQDNPEGNTAYDKLEEVNTLLQQQGGEEQREEQRIDQGSVFPPANNLNFRTIQTTQLIDGSYVQLVEKNLEERGVVLTASQMQVHDTFIAPDEMQQIEAGYSSFRREFDQRYTTQLPLITVEKISGDAPHLNAISDEGQRKKLYLILSYLQQHITYDTKERFADTYIGFINYDDNKTANMDCDLISMVGTDLAKKIGLPMTFLVNYTEGRADHANSEVGGIVIERTNATTAAQNYGYSSRDVTYLAYPETKNIIGQFFNSYKAQGPDDMPAKQHRYRQTIAYMLGDESSTGTKNFLGQTVNYTIELQNMIQQGNEQTLSEMENLFTLLNYLETQGLLTDAKLTKTNKDNLVKNTTMVLTQYLDDKERRGTLPSEEDKISGANILKNFFFADEALKQRLDTFLKKKNNGQAVTEPQGGEINKEAPETTATLTVEQLAQRAKSSEDSGDLEQAIIFRRAVGTKDPTNESFATNITRIQQDIDNKERATRLDELKQAETITMADAQLIIAELQKHSEPQTITLGRLSGTALFTITGEGNKRQYIPNDIQTYLINNLPEQHTILVNAPYVRGGVMNLRKKQQIDIGLFSGNYPAGGNVIKNAEDRYYALWLIKKTARDLQSLPQVYLPAVSYTSDNLDRAGRVRNPYDIYRYYLGDGNNYDVQNTLIILSNQNNINHEERIKIRAIPSMYMSLPNVTDVQDISDLDMLITGKPRAYRAGVAAGGTSMFEQKRTYVLDDRTQPAQGIGAGEYKQPRYASLHMSLANLTKDHTDISKNRRTSTEGVSNFTQTSLGKATAANEWYKIDYIGETLSVYPGYELFLGLEQVTDQVLLQHLFQGLQAYEGQGRNGSKLVLGVHHIDTETAKVIAQSKAGQLRFEYNVSQNNPDTFYELLQFTRARDEKYGGSLVIGQFGVSDLIATFDKLTKTFQPGQYYGLVLPQAKRNDLKDNTQLTNILQATKNYPGVITFDGITIKGGTIKNLLDQTWDVENKKRVPEQE